MRGDYQLSVQRRRRTLAAAAGGVAPLTATYINSATLTTDLTTYDFGNFDVGAGGLVVVAVAAHAGGTRSVSSVSIGGTNGTVVVTTSGVKPCGIASRVASGTINVSVTFSAGCLNASVAVWVLGNVQSTTANDFDQASSGTADNTSVAATLDIPAGGVAIFAHAHSNSNAASWSSATGKLGSAVESSFWHAAAELLSTPGEVNHAETVSWVTNATRGVAAASWR